MNKKIDKEYLYKIFPILNELTDEKLIDTVIEIWDDIFQQSRWEKIEDACFSPEMKNQKLVDHINVATVGSLRISECIEQFQNIKFNKNLIIAFGLLHDVSKLLEYEPVESGIVKKSEIGETIQHGVMGAVCAQKYGLPLEYMHLILTHTPQSKMKPKIKEGILFSYVDLCDADMLHYENSLPLFLKE